MPRLARNSFDDEKFFKVASTVAIVITVAWVAFLIGLAYVAFHFLAKFW